jgi:hypothetical protein
MPAWTVNESDDGLRLASVPVRSLGSSEFTWADLLFFKLSGAQVYTLYFPSRFDLAFDGTVKTNLTTFGQQTGKGTSVNFWDPTDPEFSRALTFFDLEAPPAVVLASGMRVKGKKTLDRAHMYAISFTDRRILEDRERLADAVNTAHEVLVRGDPAEIAGYVRQRAAASVLDAMGRIGAAVRDQILKLKPKVQIPGGASLQLG